MGSEWILGRLAAEYGVNSFGSGYYQVAGCCDTLLLNNDKEICDIVLSIISCHFFTGIERYIYNWIG
jgi:hypothetical protein